MLWDKTSYYANIHFIIDSNIREYDISKANISVLRDANVISEEQYRYLYTAPRMERQIFVGKMQGNDPTITQTLKQGIQNAKKVFLESNQIPDHEVLFIRNDAIGIIGNRYIGNTKVTDRVSFRLDGKYTSFYRLDSIHLFYLYDIVSQHEELRIKGMSDNSYALHNDYMIDFLKELFCRSQLDGAAAGINILQNFYKQYIDRGLSVGYYREFNSSSYYKLIKEFSSFSTLYLDNATEWDKTRVIDISYNEWVLRTLNRILASVYFGKR